MNTKVFLDCKVIVHVESFVAERTGIHFLVLTLIFRAVMGVNRTMICTECLLAVLALYWQPVFLLTGV